VVERGYAGLLMTDPPNIRYATDSTKMQLWNTHNPFRAVLLCADGYIRTNMEMLKPGVTIPELTANYHAVDERFQAQKCGCLMHGLGLCDDWPLVTYPDQAVAGAYDYPLEPGMTLCVEVLTGKVGGDF
jgi:Xaa-Pro aminopeptidase